MKRTILAGLVTGAVLMPAAGCDGAGGPEPAATPAGALAEVRAAAARTVATPAHVTMGVSNVAVTGDADPAGRKLTLAITSEVFGETIRSSVRVLGDDTYATLGRTALPDVDPTKFIRFPTGEAATVSPVHLGDPFDPGGIKALTAAMTEARQTAAGSYAGRLDLGEAAAGTSRGLLPASAEQLADAGGTIRDIPYTATVDGEGRLTGLTLRMPAYGRVPAYTSKVAYSALGRPVEVAKPSAAQTTEVPEAVRRLLVG